jgi:hypothetical protein
VDLGVAEVKRDQENDKEGLRLYLKLKLVLRIFAGLADNN